MQESRRQLSLLTQLRVVLMSYLTRPGLHWAALGFMAGLILYGFAVVISRAHGHTDVDNDPITTMIAVVGRLMVSGGIVGFLILFLLHARQQLVGWTARIFPHTRTANLIVAGVALPLFAAIATCIVTGRYSIAFGLFIVYFGTLILAAYVFARPWLLVLLIIGGWAINKYTFVGYRIDALNIDVEEQDKRTDERIADYDTRYAELTLSKVHGVIPEHRYNVFVNEHATLQALRLARRHDYYRQLQTERIVLFLADLLAFIGLGWIARPSRSWVRSIIVSLRSGTSPAYASEAIALREHTFIASRLSRSLHRRVATHDWRAGAVAALAMSGLSVWFNLQFRVETAVPMLTLMLAFLPGALVAVGWRERWPTFEFESLYPVSRREQITDMAVGLMLDVAEFWIASAVAVVVVCAVLRTAVLHDPRFWVALLAGGMMQFLWLGGIFFVGQRRQLSSYVAGLTPGVVAIFLPLQALWRLDHAMPKTVALLTAITEMLIGLAIFVATWAVIQRRPCADGSRLPRVGQAI